MDFWNNYGLPALLALASVFLGFGLPAFGISLELAVGIALVLFAGAAIIAWHRRGTLGAGGKGGSARVRGDRSKAVGGAGGEGGLSQGGKGGDADVIGDNSSARGGKGGDAAPS